MDWSLISDPFVWVQLLTAILCGTIIGIEREVSHKAAGLRTTMLICLGATVYILIGEVVAEGRGSSADPTRVIGQVVTGIGFLGAGVILHHGLDVVGLTTAATIWLTAAVGVVIGAGYPLFGFLLTVLAEIMLFLLRRLERALFRRQTKRPSTGGED